MVQFCKNQTLSFPLFDAVKRGKRRHSCAVMASKAGRDGFRDRTSKLVYLLLSGRFQWHPFHTQLNLPSLADSPDSNKCMQKFLVTPPSAFRATVTGGYTELCKQSSHNAHFVEFTRIYFLQRR